MINFPKNVIPKNTFKQIVQFTISYSAKKRIELF